MLQNQQASYDFKLECIGHASECKLVEIVTRVRCNNHDNTDIPDVENFEVNEPRLGSTSCSTLQQTEFVDDTSIRKPLKSLNHQLGAVTTRSSPRLASGSAVNNSGALDLSNTSNNP